MTDNIREFSPELLTQSRQERLDFFKDSNRTIMHRNLKIAYDRAYSIFMSQQEHRLF
jgi:hypothetical protein